MENSNPEYFDVTYNIADPVIGVNETTVTTTITVTVKLIKTPITQDEETTIGLTINAEPEQPTNIFNNIFTRQITAIILLVFMIVSIKLIKNDKLGLTNKKQIIILLTSIAIIYVALIYILGIFIGFYNATVKLSMWSILNYIIPYIVIIISSEIIRKTILLKEDKKSKLIILMAMVILDVLLWTNIYNLKTAQDYFTLIFFIIFSSIANNLLYNNKI